MCNTVIHEFHCSAGRGRCVAPGPPAMIVPLLLLLAAAESVTLFDDVIKVPRSQWRAIRLDLQQRPATIEVAHEVLRGRSAVRVVLMTSEDVERFSKGQ